MRTTTERVREWRLKNPKRGWVAAYSYGKSSTECRNGHPRTPENISVRPDGDIRCQECERVNRRFHRYGLTAESWTTMFALQGNACASCGATETKGWDWHTDHDHACCPGDRSCGKCVRGILCDSCNRALGIVSDSISKLNLLVEYLKRTTHVSIDTQDRGHDKLLQAPMF